MKITYVVYRVVNGDGIEYLFDDKKEAEEYAEKHRSFVEIRKN